LRSLHIREKLRRANCCAIYENNTIKWRTPHHQRHQEPLHDSEVDEEAGTIHEHPEEVEEVEAEEEGEDGEVQEHTAETSHYRLVRLYRPVFPIEAPLVAT
jgi:hypothetical protein